jgi:hypothetical protein
MLKQPLAADFLFISIEDFSEKKLSCKKLKEICVCIYWFQSLSHNFGSMAIPVTLLGNKCFSFTACL